MCASIAPIEENGFHPFEPTLWRQGYAYVAGLDEAGRGAWAGPVFGAAVVLPPDLSTLGSLAQVVRDSKVLSPNARELAYEAIRATALYIGIGASTPDEIDTLGIARATELAWLRALRDVDLPDVLLIDAFKIRSCFINQVSIVDGDALCLSIAAASVVAKVSRDRYMAALTEYVPGFSFHKHKGYGTRAHQAEIAIYGVTPQHRRSFAPISTILGAQHE